jgi:hypothetical protein
VNAVLAGIDGPTDARAPATRVVAVALVWFGGLAAGFVGILAAVAKYGCGLHDAGFACETSGSVCGVLIVLAAVAVVTAVTMLTFEQPTRRVLIVSGIGFAGLVALFVLAEVLLATV